MRVLSSSIETTSVFWTKFKLSNSFADECLAKLLLTMSLDELKQRTTFVGVNDFARKNIAIAFRRRLASNA